MTITVPTVKTHTAHCCVSDCESDSSKITVQCSDIVLTLILQKGNMPSDLLILEATESLLRLGCAPSPAFLICISWKTMWSVTDDKMLSNIQYPENFNI